MAKFKPDSRSLFKKQISEMEIGDTLEYFEVNYFATLWFFRVPGGWLCERKGTSTEQNLIFIPLDKKIQK